MNLISCFGDGESGRITIGGADVTRIGETALSDLVAVVVQDVYLFGGTIRGNIALASPNANTDAIENAARATQAHTFFTQLPQRLRGGGERQRIYITRAILKDAPIVLMDAR